jgi:hypothetical protein
MSQTFATSIIAAGFDFKSFKTWSSLDGGGFQYTLLHNGNPVATVMNDGNGGPTLIAWAQEGGATPAQIKKAAAAVKNATAAKLAMDALVSATPPQHFHGMDLKVDAEWVADELVNIAQKRKALRNKTLFLVNGIEYQIKSAYNGSVAAYIKGKYPTASILNENPIYSGPV